MYVAYLLGFVFVNPMLTDAQGIVFEITVVYSRRKLRIDGPNIMRSSNARGVYLWNCEPSQGNALSAAAELCLY